VKTRHPSGAAALTILAVASMVGLSGCQADSLALDSPGAEIRLLHAAAGIGALDVQVGDATVIRNVPYGASSALVMVPAGRRHVEIRSGGTVVGSLDQTLSAEHVNSLVVTGQGRTQFSAAVTPDTGGVAPNRANLRLVNVVGEGTASPTLLDLRLDPPDPQQPDSVVTFGVDASVASYSSLLYFDPGDFSVQLLARGGSTVLAQAQFAVALGETKVIVIRRDGSGGYHLEIVVEQ